MHVRRQERGAQWQRPPPARTVTPQRHTALTWADTTHASITAWYESRVCSRPAAAYSSKSLPAASAEPPSATARSTTSIKRLVTGRSLLSCQATSCGQDATP